MSCPSQESSMIQGHLPGRRWRRRLPVCILTAIACISLPMGALAQKAPTVRRGTSRIKTPKVKLPAVKLPTALKQVITQRKLRAFSRASLLKLPEGRFRAQKYVDRQGKSVAIAWDARGRRVDLEALFQKRMRAVDRTRGKLGIHLHRALRRFRPNQRVEVRVLLKSPPQEEGGLARISGQAGFNSQGKGVGRVLKANALKKFKSDSVKRLRTVQSRFGVVSNRVKRRFVAKKFRVNYISSRSPVLSASLQSKDIQRLAADPDVQAVFLPQTMRPHLNNSRNSVRMPDVWNRRFHGRGGYSGSGRRQLRRYSPPSPPESPHDSEDLCRRPCDPCGRHHGEPERHSPRNGLQWMDHERDPVLVERKPALPGVRLGGGSRRPRAQLQLGA